MNIHTGRAAISLMVLLLGGCASTGSGSASDAAAIKAGLTAASAAKVSVAEQFAVTGVWADSNAAAGYEAPMTGPAEIVVGAGGVVSVSYAPFGGRRLVLTPAVGAHGQVKWSCASHGFDADVVPDGCLPSAAQPLRPDS